MKVVHIRISTEDEGAAALYIDGEQVVSGDDYAINARIDGVMHGLQIMGWDGRVTLYTLADGAEPPACEDGECFPEYIDEFDFTNLRRTVTRWGAY